MASENAESGNASPSIDVHTIQQTVSQERRFTYVHTLDSSSMNLHEEASSSPPQPTTTIKSSTAAVSSSVTEINAKCFRFLAHIGEGSFSEVYKCREISSGRLVAIKCCEKLKIKREKKVDYILREKNIMAQLKHPLFVHLFYTFQDQMRLYFVLTLAPHGELLNHMRRVGSLDVSASRFYAAEIVLALQYLHYDIGVIHRDLKPENVLLSETNHIMLSDFGSAKILTDAEKEMMISGRNPAEAADDESDLQSTTIHEQKPVQCTDSDEEAPAVQSSRKRRVSFVGTAQYVSPELLEDRLVSFTADYWALGCIVYQMIAGLPPFREASEYRIFCLVREGTYTFPLGFPDIPKQFVSQLLVVDEKIRLGSAGSGGIEAIKAHKFFDGIRWDDLLSMEPPRIMPYLPASGDEPEHRSTTLIYDADLDEASIPPGLDGELNRLHGLLEFHSISADTSVILQLPTSTTHHFQSPTSSATPTLTSAPPPPAESPPIKPQSMFSLLEISAEDRKRRLREQRERDPLHRFVNENLILKKGYCEKKVGLFSRNRMFLLTEGPHLYYVDTTNGRNELKGEVPLSAQMRTEAKNFTVFFIHTPSRIYYLYDRGRNAEQWCEAIDNVRDFYFNKTTYNENNR